MDGESWWDVELDWVGGWRGVCRVVFLLGMVAFLLVGWRGAAVSAKVLGVPVVVDPNAACAGCHREIAERYRRTPMARASGLAVEGFLPARFTHAASGVSYRISEQGGRVYLDFERAGVGIGADEQLKGRRELQYFLGSGKRGRTYLFEDRGYWFEIPINWYGKKRVWDMAPGYLRAREMPLTLPVDGGCLRCHASGAQASLPEARNRYAAEPFLEGGITCAACHGDGAGHVASGGRTGMQKIGAMTSAKRDSVCLNCHLEGQVAVVKAGKRLVDFRPGESIFDYASYFVHAGDGRAAGGWAGSFSGGRATSQWEALLGSACKRSSGAALTCTSCHDPHGTTEGMGEAERVAFYRGRCLSCHGEGGRAKASGAGFVREHHAESQDCAGCHMERNASTDIAHEQVTDHQIVRIARKAAGGLAPTVSGPLVLVGAEAVGEPAGERELGLAYAQLVGRAGIGQAGAAQGGLDMGREERLAVMRARELLTAAEKLPGAAGDAELHGQLGFLAQRSGETELAGREYELALEADGLDAFAAGNLALVKAGERQYGAAAELWSRAFEADPVELRAGMNLAIVECGLGRKEAAEGALVRMLEFSPDDGAAREMLRGIRSGERRCVRGN